MPGQYSPEDYERARRVWYGKVTNQIKQNTILPPGSDCQVWVGPMDRGARSPYLSLKRKTPSGEEKPSKVWVKRWLLGEEVERGHMPRIKTVCGVGRRCINPEHQIIMAQVPFDEWSAERTKRILAEKEKKESE